jgi:capsular polysaccharide transport system permease protein
MRLIVIARPALGEFGLVMTLMQHLRLDTVKSNFRRPRLRQGRRAAVQTILPPPPQVAARARFQRLRVIAAMMIREMATRYGSSTGGYVWAVIEPLGGILLLSIVFSLALRTPPLGNSFVLFYATGVVPFSMYRFMANGVAASISSNRGLLRYPVVSVFDAVAAKFLLNFITVAVIGAALFGGIVLFTDAHVNLDLGRIAVAGGLAAALGLGVGVLNCVLFGFFPNWKNLWSILNRPLFLVSGVFFLFESAPPGLRDVLWWNPLVHVIGVMRSGFYGTYEPHYVSYVFVLGVVLGLFVTGAFLLRRHAVYLIER